MLRGPVLNGCGFHYSATALIASLLGGVALVFFLSDPSRQVQTSEKPSFPSLVTTRTIAGADNSTRQETLKLQTAVPSGSLGTDKVQGLGDPGDDKLKSETSSEDSPENSSNELESTSNALERTKKSAANPDNTAPEGHKFIEHLTSTSTTGGHASPVTKPDSSILNPTVGVIEGSEAVWQIPDEPKAALFLAHGCNHKATHFWDPHEKCPQCVGLPEDRALVIGALQRGYAVLALSSSANCWSVKWRGSPEILQAASALQSWRKDNNLTSLPFFALGASSGGYFISVLAHHFPFDALVIMISCGVRMAFESPITPLAREKDSSPTLPYPPSLFVHMPRDERTADGVQEAISLLKSNGVNAAELQCPEIPLSDTFFSERIECIDKDTSRQIFEALRSSSAVGEDGRLARDGRALDWSDILKRQNVDLSSACKGHRYTDFIEEELNMAYAYHEMTSLNSSSMFDWFENKCEGGGSISETKSQRANHRCDSFPVLGSGTAN
eukprot:TRINITY_DN38427_c0_g1_i1.p1 TRINITY_DN38427_c0_g1~~TRINITY_DN38427_c0_g1_i1.p1  ORF type:complete len:499 (+),score=39.80 TRINITY_DN38427_c0_g1_i1:719-2215(+)